MNDIIGDVAQELADHLEDLMSDEGVVPNFNEGDDHPIEEVGDPEPHERLRAFGGSGFSFFAVVGGQRVRVMVSAEEARYVPPKRRGKTDEQKAFEQRTDFPGWENL